MISEELVSLGKSDIRVAPLGIGAWEWGDKLTWGFGGDYSESDCRDAYGEAINAGVNFIDTAEIYGQGKSERLLGQFMRET
ncbi:MAG TPA: aldo/keto reductase, partial [Anaerolineae bacterium]